MSDGSRQTCEWETGKACYLDRIVNERDRQYEIRFENSEKALVLATRALELRLESMNEFRAQIQNERALYVTRDQLDDLKRLVSTRLWALGIAFTLATAVIQVLAHAWFRT